MKLGIFADVHGNLEALEAVVRLLRDRGAARFVCCGDIVGYGPDPNRCIEVVRGLDCVCVAGNHDRAAAGSISIDGFSPVAASAVLWMRPLITEANRLYLGSLPLTAESGPLFIVHASPSAPGLWEYVLTAREAACEMEYCPASACLVGHSHVPLVTECLPGETARLVRQNEFNLKSGARYFINAGSVGQPRDGDQRACCLLFDDATQVMRYFRVAYEIQAVQAKIRAAGLPEFLASRLESGR